MTDQLASQLAPPLAPQSASWTFSTAAFSDADRVEAWRDLFGHTICGLDIEPLADQPFRSEAVLRALPGLGVASGCCSGAHYARPAHRIDSDDFIFVINYEGTDRARVSGRESLITPGEAMLFSADDVCSNANTGMSRFTTLRIPRTAIEPAVPGTNAISLTMVTRDNKALSVLKNYLSVLEDVQALTTLEQQQLIASHVHDLIVLSLGATPDAKQSAKTRGLAAARLRAIKRDIQFRVGSPLCTLAHVAARHDVTPRYVQMLFESEGGNFSDYHLLARLAKAHRMLREPANKHRGISAIAFESGFGDISYFNKTFRIRFGITPSDVRRHPQSFELPVPESDLAL